MIEKISKYVQISAVVMFLLIFLSFLGYLFWINSYETILLPFTIIVFFLQPYWLGYYWFLLIFMMGILAAFLFFKFSKKIKISSLSIIMIFIAIGIWLIIPFVRDTAITPQISNGQIIRLTHNLEDTKNPAIRLGQITEHLTETGCVYWLEGWSKDGQFIKVSEKSYGSHQCPDSKSLIFDVLSKEVTQTSADNFIFRSNPEREIFLLGDNLKENNNYKVYDILPLPKEKTYAVILGKNSLTGPHEIFIYTLD